MARIELNVVALGDFSSVNTQIKNLQTQVALLQKGLAGVGVNTALAKDLSSLSASFKQTMLSSGQFTEQTIKMQTETAKFGQALETGKLKLTDYFSLIRKKSSEAVIQMKALAVEQTKLQNSIVISDPTKQGLLSVYTPTQIDKVAQATKIAANEANLYAIAVNKGSQALTNWGKNTQWAGRQLTVGLTVPMAMFGSQAVRVFKDVNDQLVRLQKVYGTGLVQPSKAALDGIRKQTVGLAQELAATMGISAKDTAAMAADLAATGKTGVDLLTATREAMRLSKLGELDTQSAMKATVSLQNVYKLSTQQLSGAVDFLNAVENQTSTSLQDLVDGIPRVGPIVQQLGGSFKDTAIMMVAMKEAGVPAAQSANAIKSAIASLINPTKAAKDAFAAYNINLAGIATSTGGNPVKMIMELQAALKGLAPLAQAQLIEKLFGKFQEARIQALITNLGAANSQTKTAFDLMNANSQQLSSIASGEMKTATESVTGKYQRAMESFKSSLIPIGEKIMEVGTKLLDFGNKVAKIFNSLPGPLKSFMGALALGVALAGPIIMLTGLIANFAGYLLKGFFNLKQLATGGKTLGQLLTPELIAAQNASQLFNADILTNVSSIGLLEKAIQELTIGIEGMVGALNMGTGVGPAVAKQLGGYKQMRLPGFASGFVPGSGDGTKDTYPAMLAPGEAVIDAKTTKANLPFINAMMNNNLPKYAASNWKDIYFGDSPGKEGKDYSAPKAIAGGAKAIMGSEFESGIKNIEIIMREMEKIGVKLTQNQYNAAANADLMHVDKAEWTPDQRKKWEVSKIRGGMHPENAVLQDLASEGSNPEQKAIFAAKVNEARDAMIKQATSPQTISEIERAAESIKIGNQPIEKLGMEIFTKALQAVKKDIYAGKLKPAAAYSNALLAEGIMTSRMDPAETAARGLSPMPSSYKALTDVGAKTEFNKLRKNVAEEVAIITAEEKQAGEKVGVALIEGLSYGIKSRMPQAEAIIRGVVKSTITAASIAAEIKSPSRIMQKLGQMFGLGWVTGINSMDAEARAAGANLANQSELGAAGIAGKGGLASRIFKGGAGKGTGVGMLGLMAGSMITPQLSKIPGVGQELSTAGSWASMASMTMNPELIAAAALAGFAVSGIQHLIATEKIHQAEAKATFTASSDAAKFFGGTVQDVTNHVKTLTAAEDNIIPPKVKGLATQFADVNDKLTSFTAMAKSLPKDNPLSLVLDKIKSTADSNSAAKIASEFVNIQTAIGNIDPSKAQQFVNLMLAMTGKTDMVGKADTAKSQVDAIKKTILDATKNGQIGNVIPQLTNAAINSTSLQNFKNIMDGITGSGMKSSEAIGYFAQSLNDIHSEKQISALAAMGYKLADIAKIMILLKAGVNIDVSGGPGNMSAINKQLDAYYAKLNAATKPLEDQKKAYQGALDGTNAQIKALESKKKIIDRELKAQQDMTAEMQRQEQYLLKQGDLANKMREARAGGNYLQSAMLQQEMFANQADYANQGATNLLQQQSDALGQKIADLQDSTNNLSTSISTLSGKIDKLAGSITIPNGPQGQITGAKPLTVTAYDPKPGEKGYNPAGIKSYKDQYGNPVSPDVAALIPTQPPKGTSALHHPLQHGKVLDMGISGAEVKDYTDPSNGYIYDRQGNVYNKKGNFIGRWFGYAVGNDRKVVGYAGGGLINGPGTWNSDSILARLSNNEYVMNAASVSKYGPSFMQSINNRTFNPSFPNMNQSSLNVAPSGTMGSTYNITVNAETNADANQIAQTVMDTIKRQTAMTQTIRSVRV